MRVLHAYNESRFAGGANNAAAATIAASRAHGLEVEVFLRSSRKLAPSLRGRLQAGASAFYPAEAVKAFDAALSEFQPDVVHVHELFPLVSPWILPRCTRRGVPVVMTVLDYRLTCPVGTHLREGRICDRCTGGHEHWALFNNCRGNRVESATVTMFNAMARRMRLYSDHVTRFVTPSAFTRSWLVEKLGLEPARVTVVPCLVEIPPEAADPAAGTYVGCATRLSPEKGIDVLVQAARLSGLPFRLSRNEASLVAVDVPPDVPVDVTRGKADLAAFYRGARMHVFPSIWFETFGLVGAESMSHGLPVIAARVGALQDLVQDGVDGLLFEMGDARDLARKVAQLWEDPELCRRLGRAAREKAVSQWSPASHVGRLMSIYEDLCGVATPASDDAAGNAVAAARGTRRGSAVPMEASR